MLLDLGFCSIYGSSICVTSSSLGACLLSGRKHCFGVLKCLPVDLQVVFIYLAILGFDGFSKVIPFFMMYSVFLSTGMNT